MTRSPVTQTQCECSTAPALTCPPLRAALYSSTLQRVVARTASQTYQCLLLLCPQVLFCIHARCHGCRETDWRAGVVAEQPAVVAAATHPTCLLNLPLRQLVLPFVPRLVLLLPGLQAPRLNSSWVGSTRRPRIAAAATLLLQLCGAQPVLLLKLLVRLLLGWLWHLAAEDLHHRHVGAARSVTLQQRERAARVAAADTA